MDITTGLNVSAREREREREREITLDLLQVTVQLKCFIQDQVQFASQEMKQSDLRQNMGSVVSVGLRSPFYHWPSQQRSCRLERMLV